MGLVEQVRERQQLLDAEEAGCKKTAIDYIVEIAVRELTYKTRENDAESLLTALADWQMSLDDYAEILDAIPRIASWQEQIEDAKALRAEFPKYRALYKREQLRAEARVREAERAMRKRDVGSQLINSESELRRLAGQVPFLFQDGKPLPALNAIPRPEPRAEPAKKVCLFCEGKFVPDSKDQQFCGYRCQRESAALAEADLQTSKTED